MIQHVNQKLYTDKRIFWSVWWVVAAFIFIGGYNTMASYKRKGRIYIKQKLLQLVIPYSIATCIYEIYKNKFLSAEELIDHLIHFNAAGPLYYVAVYLQLVIISPFLIGIIKWADEKYKIYRYGLVSFMIFFICFLSVHYTDIFGIAIGGGNLFAGGWLLFWYIGMIYAKKKKEFEKKKKIIICIIFFILNCLWEYLFVIKEYNILWKKTYGSIFGGEQIGMTWWNVVQVPFVIIFVKLFIELITIRENKIVDFVLMPICFIGRQSLYIFMYHILFRDIYLTYFSYGNIWARRVICFGLMIGGPLAIYYILHILGKVFIEILGRMKVTENRNEAVH